MVNGVRVSVDRSLSRSFKNVATVNAEMVTGDRANGGSRALLAENDSLCLGLIGQTPVAIVIFLQAVSGTEG
jgi:hypothetical protein